MRKFLTASVRPHNSRCVIGNVIVVGYDIAIPEYALRKPQNMQWFDANCSYCPFIPLSMLNPINIAFCMQMNGLARCALY